MREAAHDERKLVDEPRVETSGEWIEKQKEIETSTEEEKKSDSDESCGYPEVLQSEEELEIHADKYKGCNTTPGHNN